MEPTPPLWSASNQPERLAELTAKTSDANKEAPLRRDVRSLGVLLGRVLVEQAGPVAVRHRRAAAPAADSASRAGVRKRPTEEVDSLLQEAKAEVAALDVATAYRVTKAFAAYFELTNLAETNHRKRRRRAAELHTDEPPLPGSFRGTLLRMKQAGITLAAGTGGVGRNRSAAGVHGASHGNHAARGLAEAPSHCRQSWRNSIGFRCRTHRRKPAKT